MEGKTMVRKCNRAEILENVERLMKRSEEFKTKHPYYGYETFPMRSVCDELSIFDWWVDELSYSRLKQMKSFLKTAGQFGYDGYVCFKVGASGCANGMWAHKNESETGYSPDGEFIYRSFTPDYTVWDAKLADGTMASKEFEKQTGRWQMTMDELTKILKEQK